MMRSFVPRTRKPMSKEKRGSVVTYPQPEHAAEHERVTHREIARRLAKHYAMDFLGEYDPAKEYPAPVYFVPADVLVDRQTADRLGIRSENDLFGGVVAASFMATKAIVHPLVSAQSPAPSAWSDEFCQRVQPVVLAGYSAFSLDDAKVAGCRLLERGPVRIKAVRATAGRGQAVATSVEALNSLLKRLDADEIASHGLVLEEHLSDVTTHSVGHVRIGDSQIAYYGTQHLTTDNQGAVVYGGTDIVVVEGSFEALLTLKLSDELRDAVSKAQIFDTAATQCLPGFFASRRNYDVACGVDAKGVRRVGVLEQSWRIGGASSAEVIALEAFQATPAPTIVQASSIERYGAEQKPPPEAIILFSGVDATVGPIMKCVMLGGYDYQQ